MISLVIGLALSSQACLQPSLAPFFGEWRRVGSNSETVLIKSRGRDVYVDLHTPGQRENEIKAIVTTDGRLVVPVRGALATVLAVDPSTHLLRGGEFIYRRM